MLFFSSRLDRHRISIQRSDMLTAILVFLPLSVVLLLAEFRLHAVIGSNALQAWLATHLYLPLMRATALLVFIFVAHPELYGLSNAPSLGSLMAAGHYRFDQLVNLLLIVSLLLPLLPLVSRLAGATLALQGMLATALIASWMASESALNLRLIPDIGVAIRIIAILLVARLLADLLAEEFIQDRARRAISIEAARMAAQLPAILIYARYLGAQLSG